MRPLWQRDTLCHLVKALMGYLWPLEWTLTLESCVGGCQLEGPVPAPAGACADEAAAALKLNQLDTI